MKISNPITPRSTELKQDIMYAKNQIAYIRNKFLISPACLNEHLSISLDHWLGKLSELREELKNVDLSER